jgi:hypothetical protein
MPESPPIEAEPKVQPKFSFVALLGGAALFGLVVAADTIIDGLPNREAEPEAVAALHLEPIELSGELAPLRLAGAWRLTSAAPRFGGISALALDGEQFIAVSDSGAVLRFPKALRSRMTVAATDLPSGPGSARYKESRDAEALSRDSRGRGWWVAFEGRNELWLYDRDFTRAIARVPVERDGLGENNGMEGLVTHAEGLIAFPENGGAAHRWRNGEWQRGAIRPRRPISDATLYDFRSAFLIERRATYLGFRNALAFIRGNSRGAYTVWRKPLPVSRRDNLEGIAGEPLPGGGYRLWIISDDNFHPRLRTVLLAIDVPAALLRGRA